MPDAVATPAAPAAPATPATPVTPAPETPATPAEPAATDVGFKFSDLKTALSGEPPKTQSQVQTPAPQPTNGQAPAAPAGGQGNESGAGNETTAAAPEPGQAAAKISEDDIFERTSNASSLAPEAQIAQQKRDLGASRKEAMRLKTRDDGHEALLKAQGLKAVFSDQGEPVGYVTTEGYNGGASQASAPKFSDLTEAQQSTFESDHDAFIKHVWGMATTATTRVAPTVKDAFDPISPEMKQSVIDHMTAAVEADGKTQIYPNFAENLRLIERHLDLPTNAPVKAASTQCTEVVMGLFNSMIEGTKLQMSQEHAAIKQAQTTKETGANNSPSPGPAGGGEAVIPLGGQSANELQNQVRDELQKSSSGFRIGAIA